MTDTETATETKPQLKIESLNDLRRVLTIAKGGDPDAQQTLNNFLNFENNTERSNFPNTGTVLCVAQLNGFSKLYYPDDKDNPFALVASCLEVSFMARKGWKSEGFVEMMKSTPSLSDLQTVGEKSTGLVNRILRRGKTE